MAAPRQAGRATLQHLMQAQGAGQDVVSEVGVCSAGGHHECGASTRLQLRRRLRLHGSDKTGGLGSAEAPAAGVRGRAGQGAAVVVPQHSAHY